MPVGYPSGDVNRIVASSSLELKRPGLEIRNGVIGVYMVFRAMTLEVTSVLGSCNLPKRESGEITTRKFRQEGKIY